MAQQNHTVDITSGVGVISFPHIFKETATKNDAGETVYDLQFLIPKTDRDTARAFATAIKEVREAKWGEAGKRTRNPLRDGDKEANDPTDDGSTKGEKYPERKGHYFINARSKKPVGVVDRQRIKIEDADEVYAGCKVKVNVTFYPYSQQGNSGVGVGLNGVQKVADGEPIGGGGKPSVDSMFDLLDDEDLDDDDDDLTADEPEPEAKPAKKASKPKPAAKKAAAKKAEPEPLDDDDLADDGADEDEGDLLDDLDD